MHSRESVYAAERALRDVLDRPGTIQLHGSTVVVPVERKFGDLAAVQRYVDAVLALNWVRENYPQARTPITVRVRKGQQFAHYEPLPPIIAMPVQERASHKQWAMREIVALHEIAHHLTPHHQHDARFTAVFVELVTGVMGEEAGFLLRALFYDEGVAIG